MEAREWALILYTILTQLSVGAFIIIGVVHFFAERKAGIVEADRMSDRALLAIGPLLVLAMIASLFHLGTPANAYRAISNVGSSWLSREILFTVLFLVVGGVFALMQWRKVSTPQVRNAIAVLAAVIGVVLVYSMSRVYMIRTVPVWDNLATPISFFTTTFLLGALAVGLAYVVNYSYMQRRGEAECGDTGVQCELLRTAMRGLAIAAILLVGIHLVIVPAHLAYLSGGPQAAQESASIISEDYGVLLILRLVLVFLGAAVLGSFIYQNASSPGRERFIGNLALVAFALVLVGEVVGRFIFYASEVSLGIFVQ